MQHLLGRAVLDANAVRDDVRDCVVEHLDGPGAVLVFDETGDARKGTAPVGVQRQYTGTAGPVENAQVAVYLVNAAGAGHTFIDRAFYLPRCWAAGSSMTIGAAPPESRARWSSRPSRRWRRR